MQVGSQSKNKEAFYLKVNINECDMDETISDLKEVVRYIRMEHAEDTQKVFAEKIGFKEASVKTYEELKGKPYVGISMLKKICQAYNLKCEIIISEND